MNAASWRKRVKVHPAADSFPLLADLAPKELAEFAVDIAKNGLRQSVALGTEAKTVEEAAPDQFLLLDGRNWLDAVELAFPDERERAVEGCDSRVVRHGCCRRPSQPARRRPTQRR